MTDPALLPVLLRLAGGLAVVVAMILACAWLARRAGWSPRTQARLLRQIDQLSLGSRGSVAVLAVQDTWLVLGVTANKLTLLHSLPAPPAGEPDTTALPARPLVQSTFATLLQTLRSRRADIA